MQDSTQFEEWDFLESFFEREEEQLQWKRSKRDRDQETEMWNKAKTDLLKETKIFGLSQKYPAFNERALPLHKMHGVLNR